MPALAENPLLPLHQAASAETQNYGPIEIVSTFGQPQLEYAAIHKTAGLLDLPQRALIELTGNDRLSWLDNVLTNQVYDRQAKKALPPGRCVYSFLLVARTGRLICDFNVLILPDRVLLETDARILPAAVEQLSRYIFREDARLRPRAAELHQIALHGPAAPVLLTEAAGGSFPILAPLQCAQVSLFGVPAVVYRDDLCPAPGFGIIIDSSAAAELWSRFLSLRGDEPGRSRLQPVGWAAFNSCRIEAGRPLFGIDFDENFLPAETAQLDRAVSFNKGCYPGQEIVARMHSRKQLARQIAAFRMDTDALPIAGSPIQDDTGEQIGAVTSSTPSPILSNAAIGLAVLKRPSFELGARLKIAAEGAMRDATVVKIPFVEFRPSV